MKFWKKSNSYRVYADAAAATPIHAGVLREMRRLERLFGNPGGLHNEAEAAKEELERARASVAQSVGAHADEIFFTSGGTESNNLAIFGTLRALLHEHGEVNAVTTPIEHPSILEPLRALEREGLYITYLPVDSAGLVNPKDLREAVNEETALVSVQMVNSEVGTIQNIREIAKEVRHVRSRRVPPARALRGARPSLTLASRDTALPLYFHTDASQAPLWLPLNVEKLGVDMMTLDAQKMMGPKSSGILFARRGTELEPLILGGGQEGGLRSGTENVVLAGAVALALTEAQTDTEARAARVAEVRNYLYAEILKLLPDTVLYGATGAGRVANNLTISVPGLNGQMAVVALNARGVAASTRSACSAADEQPSHVLTALNVSEARSQEALRLTLLPGVTHSEVRTIAQALDAVAKRYRNVVN